MKGYVKLITREALENALDLPKGAHILKVRTPRETDHVFRVVCYDPNGYEKTEGGGVFPIKGEIDD